jgi:hypothetical protein
MFVVVMERPLSCLRRCGLRDQLMIALMRQLMLSPSSMPLDSEGNMLVGIFS